MKTCTQCKEEKSDAVFIKMGIQRHSMCDPCRKEYQRKYHQKLKKRRNQYGSIIINKIIMVRCWIIHLFNIRGGLIW